MRTINKIEYNDTFISMKDKKAIGGYIYVKNWRKRTKERLMQLMGGQCIICGYDKNCPSAYELHHLDPEKKDFTISSYSSHSWDKIFDEAKKCVLLCCRCHREIHDKITLLPDNFSILKEGDKNYQYLEVKRNKCPICNLEKFINNKFCSIECARTSQRKIDRPSYETLIKEINELNFEGVGRKYGVSGNAVRKWIKKYKESLVG